MPVSEEVLAKMLPSPMHIEACIHAHTKVQVLALFQNVPCRCPYFCGLSMRDVGLHVISAVRSILHLFRISSEHQLLQDWHKVL